MRATRAYLAGLGTAGTLVLAASILFVLGSAIVTYNGWPKLGGLGSPATQTLTAHPKPGSPHASHGLASVKVVKPHAGAADVPASVANKRSTLLAQASHGTGAHRSAQHSSSATISHPVAGRAPTHSSTPTKTGSGNSGSGSGGSGSGGSGSGGSGGGGSGGGTTVTVPVVSTPTPVSATPTTPVSTGSGSSGSGSGSSGSGSTGSGSGTPVVKTGSGTVVVTVPSSSGSRPTGTPVISTTGSSGSSSASGGSGYSTSGSTTTTSSSTTTTSSSSSSTTVTISAPTIPGGRGGVSGPIVR